MRLAGICGAAKVARLVGRFTLLPPGRAAGQRLPDRGDPPAVRSGKPDAPPCVPATECLVLIDHWPLQCRLGGRLPQARLPARRDHAGCPAWPGRRVPASATDPTGVGADGPAHAHHQRTRALPSAVRTRRLRTGVSRSRRTPPSALANHKSASWPCQPQLLVDRATATVRVCFGLRWLGADSGTWRTQ